MNNDIEASVMNWRASIRAEAQREMLESVIGVLMKDEAKEGQNWCCFKLLDMLKREFKITSGVIANMGARPGRKLMLDSVVIEDCKAVLDWVRGELYLYNHNGHTPFFKIQGIDFNSILEEDWVTIDQVAVSIHKRATSVKVRHNSNG